MFVPLNVLCMGKVMWKRNMTQ